eukprot:1250150-Ditylum_brightwellii.AAC.1
MAAIKKYSAFFKVILNLLLLKHMLGLLTFWLVAKYSLRILLIRQPCDCDIEIFAIKMVDLFLVASNIGVKPGMIPGDLHCVWLPHANINVLKWFANITQLQL